MWQLGGATARRGCERGWSLETARAWALYDMAQCTVGVAGQESAARASPLQRVDSSMLLLAEVPAAANARRNADARLSFRRVAAAGAHLYDEPRMPGAESLQAASRARPHPPQLRAVLRTRPHGDLEKASPVRYARALSETRHARARAGSFIPLSPMCVALVLLAWVVGQWQLSSLVCRVSRSIEVCVGPHSPLSRSRKKALIILG